MCYAIPGRVKEVKDRRILVDYFGEEKKAINELDGLCVGDYIYVQGGYVIERIPTEEAQSILSVWRETFFALQEVDLRLSQINLEKNNIDKKLLSLLDKALEKDPLKREELLYLFTLNDPATQELLFKTANFLRQKFHKNSCCVHGIVEISNYCTKLCNYCGISAHNTNLARYRLTPEEIIETSCRAVREYGFQALVLQSGEDPYFTPDILSDIVRKIKEKVPVLLCVSFGEIGMEGLEKLYQAGARALLMRFETSNAALYEKLHPGKKFESKLAHIKKAYDLGYLVITGALIGLPGQTKEDMINDIYLAKALGAEIYSFGPFLPHPHTPLANSQVVSTKEVLKILALIRLVDPENAKILIKTAFETLDRTMRREGLLCGGNSLMLNVTPIQYRKYYSIYPNKVYSNEPIEIQIEQTVSLLKSLGRAPTDLGITEISADKNTDRHG